MLVFGLTVCTVSAYYFASKKHEKSPITKTFELTTIKPVEASVTLRLVIEDSFSYAIIYFRSIGTKPVVLYPSHVFVRIWVRNENGTLININDVVGEKAINPTESEMKTLKRGEAFSWRDRLDPELLAMALKGRIYVEGGGVANFAYRIHPNLSRWVTFTDWKTNEVPFQGIINVSNK